MQSNKSRHHMHELPTSSQAPLFWNMKNTDCMFLEIYFLTFKNSTGLSSSQGRSGSGTCSLGASLEMNESMEFDRIDAGETTENISPDLLIRIKNDPSFFISFSDESLHDVINFETEQLSTALGRSLAVAQHSQEACQQELDRRMQLREATQLLKLFERARQNQANENDVQSGNKRPRTVHE